MNIQQGKVWKFGENIDTDLIIAARYLNTSDPQVLASHVMEDARPDFLQHFTKGDFIVAGENFGCGSSREHAPVALKTAGVSAVIAKSFARIFYRNSFNTGFPILEVKETDEIREGDTLEVDMAQGTIKNLTRNQTYAFKPIPPFMMELLESGGLIEHAKAKIAQGAL